MTCSDPKNKAITSWVNGHIISRTREVTELLGSAGELGSSGGGEGGSRHSKSVQGAHRGLSAWKRVDFVRVGGGGSTIPRKALL